MVSKSAVETAEVTRSEARGRKSVTEAFRVALPYILASGARPRGTDITPPALEQEAGSLRSAIAGAGVVVGVKREGLK